MKVNLKEYPSLAIRTLADKEGVDPKIHLVMGIVGEFLSEVAPVLSSSLVNKGTLEEELGDMCFYVGCYCHNEDIEFRASPTVPEDSLGKVIGNLIEMHKKNYAYGKELKHLTKPIQDIIYWIFYIANKYDINIEEMLYKNIEKLRIRYPEGFEDIRAIEKNVDEESKVFEEPNN